MGSNEQTPTVPIEDEQENTMAGRNRRSLGAFVRLGLPQLHQDGQRRAPRPSGAAARMAGTEPGHLFARYVPHTDRSRLGRIRSWQETTGFVSTDTMTGRPIENRPT